MLEVRSWGAAAAIAACLAAGSALPVAAGEAAASASGYMQPPEPLLGVMRAPRNPSPVIDPTRTRAMLVQESPNPPIARVSEPHLRLAGVRIIAGSHARHDRASGYGIRTCMEGFSVLELDSGVETPVSLPENACPGVPSWSPDGTRFAFDNTTPEGVELWVGDAASGTTRRIEGAQLNPILEGAVQWLGGSERLLVKLVPADLGPAPERAEVPPGPEITDATDGSSGESSTYEARDTLASPEDEDLFEHYGTALLATVDLPDGTVTPVRGPAVIGHVSGAPDGRHVLLHEIQRPYSYVTAWGRFARDVVVLDLDTGAARVVAERPVEDRVPVRGVPTGPRGHEWRDNQPATLLWVEALDGGDWNNEADERDRLMALDAPFSGEPREILRLPERHAGTFWFADGGRALVYGYDANRTWLTTRLMDLDDPAQPARVIWDRSLQERYADPGMPIARRAANGAVLLFEEDGALFLTGSGATPQGDRPFLDRYDLATGETTRLFRSDREAFEVFRGFAGFDTSRLLTWHQSPADPPNLFVRELGQVQPEVAEGEAAHASHPRQLSRFPDPAPQARDVQKRLVTYQRDDGVELSFTLYTPPGYEEGTRVPAVLYAYPLDYAEASTAGQVSGSDKTFTRLAANHQLLLLAGYAIIDDASFPIVGDPRNAYDTYLEQLVANAEAAVAKAVELGVVDPDRIGVTGHSHGALMAANLLAHTDLFRAGVASSGAYNKTLTPFGFQSERRSFWDAPEVYGKVSTFFHADKVDEPLLIVHGADDANPGTEPLQSPRLFQAIRGSGGTARLVMLPFEPHWYMAQESNEHFVAEMLAWFDRYVRDAGPRGGEGAAGQR